MSLDPAEFPTLAPLAERLHRMATGEEPATWRCVCGHPLYRHSVKKEPNSGLRSWHVCEEPGCLCERGHSEAELAAGERPYSW